MQTALQVECNAERALHRNGHEISKLNRVDRSAK